MSADAIAKTDNPYAVTTLEMSPYTVTVDVLPKWFRLFLHFLMAFFVIGTVVAIIEIESIVATGPILFTIGLFLAFLTRKERKELRFLTVGCLTLPVCCVLAINVFSLGPNDAWAPFNAAYVLFTLGMVLNTIRVLRKMGSAAQNPDLAVDSDVQ